MVAELWEPIVGRKRAPMPQLSLIIITGYVWRGRKTLTPTPG